MSEKIYASAARLRREYLESIGIHTSIDWVDYWWRYDAEQQAFCHVVSDEKLILRGPATVQGAGAWPWYRLDYQCQSDGAFYPLLVEVKHIEPGPSRAGAVYASKQWTKKFFDVWRVDHDRSLGLWRAETGQTGLPPYGLWRRADLAIGWAALCFPDDLQGMPRAEMLGVNGGWLNGKWRSGFFRRTYFPWQMVGSGIPVPEHSGGPTITGDRARFEGCLELPYWLMPLDEPCPEFEETIRPSLEINEPPPNSFFTGTERCRPAVTLDSESSGTLASGQIEFVKVIEVCESVKSPALISKDNAVICVARYHVKHPPPHGNPETWVYCISGLLFAVGGELIYGDPSMPWQPENTERNDCGCNGTPGPYWWISTKMVGTPTVCLDEDRANQIDTNLLERKRLVEFIVTAWGDVGCRLAWFLGTPKSYRSYLLLSDSIIHGYATSTHLHSLSKYLNVSIGEATTVYFEFDSGMNVASVCEIGLIDVGIELVVKWYTNSWFDSHEGIR